MNAGDVMKRYARGTRLMLRISRLTGISPHYLVMFGLFRWLIIELDRRDGSPPTWPR